MRFPADAMQFYAELEADNTREFWNANKARYLAVVREPMQQVADLLEPEFGRVKLYRPHRDVRFAADKSPYKTHQGAFAERLAACGWYTEVNADEVLAIGGCYRTEPEGLARYRAAVADERTGTQLERIVADLESDGWVIGGDELKTSPRGFSADHPRIRLLRHRSLFASKEIEQVGVEGFADDVAGLWHRVAPLVEWLTRVLTCEQAPDRGD